MGWRYKKEIINRLQCACEKKKIYLHACLLFCVKMEPIYFHEYFRDVWTSHYGKKIYIGTDIWKTLP